MMNGSSFIYYGEEIGMVGAGRDENKRTPMYWSNTEKEGITAGPAFMTKHEMKFDPVDLQDANPSSILNYYRRAIRIRNQFPEISRGQIEIIESLDQNIAIIRKTYEEETCIVIYNLNSKESQVTLKKEQYSYEGIAEALTTNANWPFLVGDTITLPPYAIVILK